MRICDYRVGFVGFGHMAQILFRSMDKAKLIPRSQILFTRRDPAKIKKSEQEFCITSTTLETLLEKSDLIFLCIRPQQAEAVLKQIASLGQGPKQVISILAGIRPAYYEKFLGAVPLVWAMPNLPAEVGEGMTTLSFNQHSTNDFRSAVNLIFQSMGSVVELP